MATKLHLAQLDHYARHTSSECSDQQERPWAYRDNYVPKDDLDEVVRFTERLWVIVLVGIAVLLWLIPR